MRKVILCALLWASLPLSAKANCFVAADYNHVYIKQGECDKRHAPMSTFKIAIALMGYESGILQDATHPEWPYKVGYDDFKPSWKQPHNPTTWISDSCVWYSQLITQRLGQKQFQKYVSDFGYGNKDASGGVMQAWLSSSLQISPLEQITFIHQLVTGKLSLTNHTINATKKILFIRDLANGWALYGKTGAGHQQYSDGSLDPHQQVGWFVGWIEKSGRQILFAENIEEKFGSELSAGQDAKALALKNLTHLLQ